LKLTTAIQEALLALLCFDDDEGSMVAALIEERHFDAVYRTIAELALEYRERHKQAPGTHTLDLFDQAIDQDPENEELFERLYESLKETAKNINARYVIDRARSFVRFQELKRGIAKAIRDLSRDDEEGLSAAEATLSASLKQTAENYSFGVSFIEDQVKTLAFLDRPDKALPTGIPALDAKGLGPVVKRLHLFIAPAKVGKSWWLINLSTRANQRAYQVLHITLELDEAEVCQRLVQSFFGIAKREVDMIRYRKFIETEERKEWGTNFEVCKLHNIPHLTQPDVHEMLMRKMDEFKDCPRLIVKEFPIGSLTMNGLEAYLDFLENRERFIPDLLVVDYATIMKLPSGVERWEAIIDISQNLRRIGQERRIAVATASQTKISGAKASRTDVQHVSGAWDQIATADTVLAFSRTDEEAKDRLARILVAAARTEESRFEVLISQAYEIGQFCLSSIRLGAGYYAGEPKEE